MAFKPQDYVMNMRGKDYLEVKWRIAWFRDEHPRGSILTEIAHLDPVVLKATIVTEDGQVLATGYGTPKQQGVASNRPFEGAETAAIGRALAAAGYGTQFTGEDEGEHIADAPVERPPKKAKASKNGGVKVPANALERADESLFEVDNPKALENRQEFWLQAFRDALQDGFTLDHAVDDADKALADEIEKRSKASA